MLSICMKKKFLCILLLVTIFLSFGSKYYRIEMVKSLVIVEQDTGKKITVPLPNARFQLGFIHSVHRTPVEELFSITEDDKLVLYEIRYSSLGIGMPYDAEGGVFVNHDGQYRLTGLHKEFSVISLRASEIPAQTISAEGRVYPLLEIFQPDSLLQLSAGGKPMLVRIGD